MRTGLYPANAEKPYATRQAAADAEQAVPSPQQRSMRRGLNRVMALVAAGAAVLLLFGAGVAAAQGTTALPASPAPSVPVPGSGTATVPLTTGTLTDPSGTTVPKLTPAPDLRS